MTEPPIQPGKQRARSHLSFSRRAALAMPLPLLGSARATSASANELRVDVGRTDGVPFERERYGFVGVYDVDWLTRPEFSQMLDNLAASPGAVSGVRFFGPFTAGQPELFKPEGGGNVWTDPDGTIDFSATFAALEALVSRELIPFIALGFFPPAVSSSPVQPPDSWDGWQSLVRMFLVELAVDARFGADRIAHWWFEVWNEPNEGRFWSGTQEQYFALYRATSAAVAETGLPIRLGGPAIAYKPQVSPDDGAPWMERFLRFVAAEPELRCDFVSLHRKGTVADDPPDPRRLLDAAVETAQLALTIDGERFRGLTIVNDEADEKVGFETPYPPRMDHTAAAWLGAATAMHASLDERFRAAGLRFLAAADNANLQLVQAPFDGRRSLMTYAHADRRDLIKLPVYGFYELLRLMGDRQIPVVAGADQLFPATLYHLCTASETHVSALLTYYPDPGADALPSRTVEYVLEGLPWPAVNVALFGIDRARSNAYSAAGGSPANPFPVPDPDAIPAIRQAQELAVVRPTRVGVAGTTGIWRETLTLEPYATLCLLITPYSEEAPEPPEWLEVDAQHERTVLHWAPSQDPSFYSYELYRMDGADIAERLTPATLRAALWIEDAFSSGERTYGVRTISASGIASDILTSD